MPYNDFVVIMDDDAFAALDSPQPAPNLTRLRQSWSPFRPSHRSRTYRASGCYDRGPPDTVDIHDIYDVHDIMDIRWRADIHAGSISG